MHIVEPADESQEPASEWEGITGRVKQLLELQSRDLATKEELAMVSRRQEDTQDKLDELAMALKRIEALLQSSHVSH